MDEFLKWLFSEIDYDIKALQRVTDDIKNSLTLSEFETQVEIFEICYPIYESHLRALRDKLNETTP